jgi:hypothetical protein
MTRLILETAVGNPDIVEPLELYGIFGNGLKRGAVDGSSAISMAYAPTAVSRFIYAIVWVEGEC